MDNNIFLSIPNVEAEEIMNLKQITQTFSEEQLNKFILLYKGRRKDPQTGMITGIIPFVVGIHGIQRFYYGHIGMGIAYLLTFGFCMIGTIIDLVNNKKLALDANMGVMQECADMSKVM